MGIFTPLLRTEPNLIVDKHGWYMVEEDRFTDMADVVDLWLIYGGFMKFRWLKNLAEMFKQLRWLSTRNPDRAFKMGDVYISIG